MYKVGRDKQLDPLLLLAVIAIESRYNPLAESHVGAQGLMQVMTSVHQDKFDAVGKNPLDPGANIMVGATILKDCINRRGSVDGGLACYVGATGPDDNGYGARCRPSAGAWRWHRASRWPGIDPDPVAPRPQENAPRGARCFHGTRTPVQ